MPRTKSYSYEEELGHDLTGAAGEVVCQIDTSESPHVSYQIDGEGDTADYTVDVSATGENWYNGVKTHSAADRINGGFIAGERYVRIRRTSSEASGTANILLSAKD